MCGCKLLKSERQSSPPHSEFPVKLSVWTEQKMSFAQPKMGNTFIFARALWSECRGHVQERSAWVLQLCTGRRAQLPGVQIVWVALTYISPPFFHSFQSAVTSMSFTNSRVEGVLLLVNFNVWFIHWNLYSAPHQNGHCLMELTTGWVLCLGCPIRAQADHRTADAETQIVLRMWKLRRWMQKAGKDFVLL